MLIQNREFLCIKEERGGVVADEFIRLTLVAFATKFRPPNGLFVSAAAIRSLFP